MALLINVDSGNFTNSATWSAAAAWSTTFSGHTSAQTTTVTTTTFTLTNGLVIDGVALRLRKGSSPSGTITVALHDGAANVATGTLDCTKIPTPNNSTESGWYFVKFSGTHTATGASTYSVKITHSGGLGAFNTAVEYAYGSSSANPLFVVRAQGTAAAASNDTLFVVGEVSGSTFTSKTVTMDATNAGAVNIHIGAAGKLAWPTSSGVTNKLTMTNDLTIGAFGTLEMGSQASPVQDGTVAELAFTNATAGDFGVIVGDFGTFVSCGYTKTPFGFLQVSTAASATTSSLTNAPTGWKNGDQIAVPSTSRTSTQHSTATLSADVSSTGLTHGALTNAHAVFTAAWGTTYRPTVINLTRNVKVHGTSATLSSRIYARPSAILNLRYSEFYFLGMGNTEKRGIEMGPIATTFDSVPYGTMSVVGCSLRNFHTSANGIRIQSNATAVDTLIDSNVTYQMGNNSVRIESSASGVGALTNNAFVAGSGSGGNATVHYGDYKWTLSGNIAASGVGYGFSFADSGHTTVANQLNVTGTNTAHSNGQAGFMCQNQWYGGVVNNLVSYRNNTYGFSPSVMNNMRMANLTLFGNTSTNILFNNNGLYINSVIKDSRFDNASAVGDALTTASYLSMQTVCNFSKFLFVNCLFANSTASTTPWVISLPSTPGSVMDIGFINCGLPGTSFMFNSTSSLKNHPATKVWCFNRNQSVGTHQTVRYNDEWHRDAALSKTSLPSVKVTAHGAGSPNARVPAITCAVAASDTIMVTVNVRKSVAGDGLVYTGFQPRLIVKANPALGINAEVTIATASNAANGAFMALAGTIPAVTADGVVEVEVESDPLSGFINIDDVYATKIKNASGSFTYWHEGRPFPVIGKQNTDLSGKRHWHNGEPLSALINAYVSDPFGLGDIRFRLDDDGRERLPNGTHREVVASKRRDTTVVTREVASRDGIV